MVVVVLGVAVVGVPGGGLVVAAAAAAGRRPVASGRKRAAATGATVWLQSGFARRMVAVADCRG